VKGNPLSFVDPLGLQEAPAIPFPGSGVGTGIGTGLGELLGWCGRALGVAGLLLTPSSTSECDTIEKPASCFKEKPDEEFCRKRKNYCITFCQYELDMPGRRDNFGPFRACIRRCMNMVGCDY